MSEVVLTDKLGIYDSMKNFVLNPKKFFKDRSNKSSWFFLFLLIVTTGSFLQGKTITTFFLMSMNASGAVGEDAAAIVGKLSMLFGIGLGVISSVITILFASWVILLSVRFILNGEISYRQVLSIYCISNIPNIIFNVMILLFYDKVASSISLTDFMTLFIRKVNIFTLWSFVLLVIGIAVISKVSIRKSTILFIVFAFITLTFTIGSFLITEGVNNEIPSLDFLE